MIPLSRAAAGLRAVSAATAVGLALSSCGSTPSKATSTPPGSTSTPSASSPATPSSAPAPGGGQVVEVEKYGVSFAIPKGWTTLDAKNVLKDGGKNPVLDELADRLGMTRAQLVRVFSQSVQTFSISDEGAHHGFVDNINSVGETREINDDVIKLGLSAVGARIDHIDHVDSDAGAVTRVSYVLKTKVGINIRGVGLFVQVGDDALTVTVSATSAATAATLADRVQASLTTIPGTGPGA